MKCQSCREPMVVVEKDTSSGRDMRTYECRRCKKSLDVEFGTALWKLLSDEREKEPGK